jgi:hypothetical protein
MQGHHASAISHIESGAKLLQETMYDERNRVLQHQVLGSKSHVDSYAPLKILSGMFARVDSKPMVRLYTFFQGRSFADEFTLAGRRL